MSLHKLYVEASPIAEPNISGIGHMTLELIRALERHPDCGQKFEIVLVVAFNKKHLLDRWDFKRVKVKTIPVHMRLFNILWKFDLLPPMDLLLGKGTYLFPNYKNWRLLRSKNLTFVCDVSYLVVPEFVSPKNQQFLEKNITKWVRRSNKVLAISKNAQQEIIDNLDIEAAKTLLVPCGVDGSVFKAQSSQKVKQFLSEYELPNDYILYLGNLEPRKNISGLIDAYKSLPRSISKKYPLVLVGGGGWLNEPILEKITAAQADDYNIIRPEKYIPDDLLPELYGGAKMLVHPAFYEGFGISPLQAMACGVPVIAANNSSIPEVVGDAAILVPAEDTKAISVKIEELLSSTPLQKKLVARGLEQSKKYSWDSSAKVILTELGIG